jgi:flavin-dependent dehydrogenase
MGARHLDTDVVVVGGGPAGAAAAIACATRGLAVIVVEREAVTPDKPGESLHPGVEPLLAQLGIVDGLAAVTGARHAGMWVEWGGARRFEPFGADADGPWEGFQVWRADFDELLLARARELGVEVRRPCAVTGIPETGTGVVTAEGAVIARVLVDATGRARWLGRALGIVSRRHSPRLLARYGYAAGDCPTRADAPLLAADPRGWTWTARVRPDVYQWTRVEFDGGQTPAAWMPAELAELRPVGAARGADVTWRLSERVAGPGWFMVGDAAATLDPTSSHGVLKALMSGMMAGHLIAPVVRGAVPADDAAAAYQHWLASWFAADATTLAAFYRALDVPGF